MVATGTHVHPTAIVEEGARLGEGVRIGPFCHVSSEAVIGDRTELIGHVTIMGTTTLGSGCIVYANAVLGGQPQNVKHEGGRTTLLVGNNCVIREGVTFHLGTDVSHGRTVVGNGGYFMAYSHVGHDCAVGDNVTMANFTSLGGHAEIGDSVIISGYAAVHQFVRVGHSAFIGGYAAVVGDLIPYGMALGDRAKLRGLNIVGLKRAGMQRAELHELRKAYRMLFSPERPLAENVPIVAEAYPDSPAVADILAFIAGRGKRHFTVPPLGRDPKDDGDETP